MYILLCVIHRHGIASGSGYTERLHEWLTAVVSRTHSNIHLIQQGAKVIMMHLRDVNRNERRTLRAIPTKNVYSRQLPQTCDELAH